jgi:soluble lytic murein transglycosylase-like protein
MLTDQRDGDNARPVDEVLLERAHRFNAYIQQAADTTGVESELLRAVIVVESAFDHQAISSAGAGGLMQLMPQTAARYGVTDVFDPQDNISGGARYLRDLIGLYKGNVELVLAAYNAGEAAVDRYGGKVPPYPETLAYVPRVLKVYSTLRMLDQII